MEYRFEADELVRVVHSNLDLPDEKMKLENIYDAVRIQWEDLIETDNLDAEQLTVLKLIEDRMERINSTPVLQTV